MRIPLIILAGGDKTPTRLPEEGAGKHPLCGLKGIDIRLGDRPMVDLLLDSLRAAEAFEPIFIAGPASVYGESRRGARVIDTDGSFGENLRTSIEKVMEQHPSGPLAFITCDVLPDGEELRRLLEDYERHRPLVFWFSLILAPADPELLGASAWKPQYRITMAGAEEASKVLPGHLIIVEPSRFRRDLVFRAFELAFSSRNRSIGYRLFYIVGHVIFFLLGLDLKRALRLRPPKLTVTTVYNAILLGSKLRQGTITTTELEKRFRLIFVEEDQRPVDRGRIVFSDALTMAKDIDTVEEAEEKARELGIS